MRVRRQHPEREDARYLAMRREGRTYQDIALLCGVSYETAWSGAKRARLKQKQAAAPAAEPETPLHPRDPAWVRDMVMAFPVDSLTPGSSCPHHGPIKPGSMLVCGVCHQSGMDHRPALRRNPLTDPKPEPKPKSKPGPRPTRRQRRQSTAA